MRRCRWCRGRGVRGVVGASAFISLSVAMAAAVLTAGATRAAGAAPAAAAGADAALPAELQRVIDENARSVSQLRSLSATARVAGTFEVNGKPGSYQNDVSIWVKGRKLRQDASAVPGSPMELRKVVQALPNGTRMETGFPAASRHVVTPEAEFKFRPEATAIALVAGNPDAPFGKQPSLLHEYAAVNGRPLAKKVREDWENGYRPNVSSVKDDGVDSVLIHWDYPQAQMALKVWVDPGRGHMIRKLESYYKNELTEQWTASLKDYGGGVFWPEQVEHKEWRSGQQTRQTSVHVNGLEVNPPVEDEKFTLAGIGLPPGAEVQDQILNIRYRFGAEPKLSEDFVQAVLAPGAPGGPPAAAAAGAPTAGAGGGGAGQGVAAGSATGASAAVPGSAARNGWIWGGALAAAAAVATAAIVWNRKRRHTVA